MRQAAVHFATEVDQLFLSGETWDIIVCTDMLNLAEFKGLLTSGAREIPTLVYFHENQFEYPDQSGLERDFHFAFTNFTTALSADLLWFNSQFNFDSMLKHLKDLSPRWPDFVPREQIHRLESKGRIEPPGVEFFERDDGRSDTTPHIVWASRWEHDKNPALLLEIISGIKSQDCQFQLSVLGQSFANVPPEFEEIANRFSEEIQHWGYLTKEDYFQTLASADLFLSTASHEFFGIAAVEAISSGCLPLLPDRLVYPELLNVSKSHERDRFLYGTAKNAVDFVTNLNQSDFELGNELTREFRNRYTWSKRAHEMDAAISSYLKSNSSELMAGDNKQFNWETE